MALDRNELLERLRGLARSDRQRRVFGSASHDYQLNPPLAVAVLEAFEQDHQIRLPEDYRYFMTQVGNGGAGPAYGLFPFGHDDEGRWGEVLPIGDIGQPFPHVEAWNLDASFWEGEPNAPQGTPREEEDRLWADWDQSLEERYWKPTLMNGAIPICHRGCALRQWLVVHGEQRGYVWNDLRADHAGLAPVVDKQGAPMTFTTWYLTWLEEAERGSPSRTSERTPERACRPRTRFSEWFKLALFAAAAVILVLWMAWF